MRWWQHIVLWFTPHDKDEYVDAGYGFGGGREGCGWRYGTVGDGRIYSSIRKEWRCTSHCRKAFRRLCYAIPKASAVRAGPYQVYVPRHFDTADKRCYDYGCTDDCPVGGRGNT